ncbi:MAG: hypothetical protein K9N62_15320 [Verrucomicrobia bacterium]|nr:hypothetical protein [Verrucomicrobiota bacterium]
MKDSAPKMKGKPATPRIWELYRKLQALAERGVDGEREVSRRKLARLEAGYDLGVPNASDAPDLFSGRFTRSSKARPIYSFRDNETDIASSVKWAIEAVTKIRCLHRGTELLAEGTPATARRLSQISDHIAQSFRVLLDRYGALTGVTRADRSAFLVGLYDGMMNEARDPGQRLPGRSNSARKRKAKKSAANPASGMQAHPYSIAVNLGKQIRISIPFEQIAAELEAVAAKYLAQNGR